MSIIEYPGVVLMAIGVLHVGFSLIRYRAALSEIVRDQLFNTVGEDPQRELVMYSTLFGGVVVLFGGLLWWADASTGTLPQWVGWGLLGPAGLGVVVKPRSGFLIVFVPALMILLR